MNDVKINRVNIDADVRSFHGEARQLSLSADEDRFSKMVSILDKGEVSAFEKFASSKGLVQKIEMNSLPSDFGHNDHGVASIKDQLEAFKAARAEPERPSFKAFLGSLFSREREYEDTGLGR